MADDYRVEVNQAELRKLVSDSGVAGQAAAKGAGRVRDRAKEIIKAEGRIDTGKLLQSIIAEKVRQSGGKVTYRIGSRLEYAVYQHEGVQGPIVPRRAQVLRFRPSGSNVFIFRPSVSGFEGIHFLTRALDDLKTQDFS